MGKTAKMRSDQRCHSDLRQRLAFVLHKLPAGLGKLHTTSQLREQRCTQSIF